MFERQIFYHKHTLYDFSGISSPFLKHELARHMRHPSHIVLFNLRWKQACSVAEQFGLKVSGSALDGAKHFQLLLNDARNFGVEEILVKGLNKKQF